MEAFSELDADILADERKELKIDILLEEIIREEEEAEDSEDADSDD